MNDKWRLSRDDREMAQRIAAFALMELKEFKAVFVDPYFAERYAPPLGDMQLPNDAPCEPLKALLDQLASLNVLTETEKLLRGKKLEKGKVRDEGKARAEKEVGLKPRLQERLLEESLLLAIRVLEEEYREAEE